MITELVLARMILWMVANKCSFRMLPMYLRCLCVFVFFKQKTAYEMRISDWSSDVCSSDLVSDGPFKGQRQGYDTMHYAESEVRRIAHVAFQAAQKRSKRLCSVDKANVLETSQFWRDIMIDVAREYADVQLSHMYVDNAAMQLVRAPKEFDVIVTGNLFGDILSDEAAMLTGSIGMLPSASLNASNQGLYEPSHGSAPDIAGKNIANPLATILSAAMLLRYSLDQTAQAARIEAAVQRSEERRVGKECVSPCRSRW